MIPLIPETQRQDPNLIAENEGIIPRGIRTLFKKIDALKEQ
jgi:hypothetical protein